MSKQLKSSLYLKQITTLIGLTVGMHSSLYAQDVGYLNKIKRSAQNLIQPQDNQLYQTAQMRQLSNFQFQPDSNLNALPVVRAAVIGEPAPLRNLYTQGQFVENNAGRQWSIDSAVQVAVKRNPDIAQSLAVLAGQNANIDVAKAGYYPQLKAGMDTGDFTATDKGRQLYTIQANQMLYDFGKVGSSVDTQKNKLLVEQAKVLVSIDDIATRTARTILAVLKYQTLTKIAQDQVSGVTRLYEIARLRANAGISSEADPVQAQSYVEFSKSYLIAQQNFLKQEQQKLSTLLGFEAKQAQFTIPEALVNNSGLYDDVAMNTIPSMIAAQAEIEVAQSQKKQTELSHYPTISLVGSVNKALNGKHPSTGVENDTDSSIAVSMSSNFYQGGAVGSQMKAASFAEQAARSKLNSIYLNILDSTRIARENIANTTQQISILQEREQSTAKTRELYEEQYKLGKRSILDLLSSEQSYHSSRAERESARYDIYDTVALYIHATGRSRDVYHLNNMKIQGFEVQP